MTERRQTVQVSFGGGLLDPAMKGSVDTKQYHAGALQLENVIGSITGGVRMRPGLRHRDTITVPTASAASPDLGAPGLGASVVTVRDRVITGMKGVLTQSPSAKLT